MNRELVIIPQAPEGEPDGGQKQHFLSRLH